MTENFISTNAHLTIGSYSATGSLYYNVITCIQAKLYHSAIYITTKYKTFYLCGS